jgi:hypothetical protein
LTPDAAAAPSAPERPRRDLAPLADMAGAIERWAGDLAIGEEPSRFVRALEDGAP